jgi:magnesium transporter
VLDVAEDATTRELQLFGGSEALDAPYMEISGLGMVKKRAGWLVVLFLGEMLTATAMGFFEQEIARAVVLALFVPLISSSGGNSGPQEVGRTRTAISRSQPVLTPRRWRALLRGGGRRGRCHRSGRRDR